MIKGKVQIELHNHSTGLRDRIEQENMVTNAIPEIIAAYVKCNHAIREYTDLSPLATVGLAGLFLFDGTLTEDEDNYYFPSEAKFVASAGNYVDTSSIYRGSKNTLETGWIDEDTYMHVWDFNTSQANAIIKSLSLTHVDAGAAVGNSLKQMEDFGAGGFHYDYDTGEWEKFYYSSGVCQIVQNKAYFSDIPLNMNVSSPIDLANKVLANASFNRTYAGRSVIKGNDAYFVYDKERSGGSSNVACAIGKINIETLAETYDVITDFASPYRNYQAVTLGIMGNYLYVTLPDVAGVRKYDLSNYSLVEVVDTGTTGGALLDTGGGCLINTAGCILYPDGTVKRCYGGGSDVGVRSMYNENLQNTHNNMLAFRNGRLYTFKNYLGTICNLAQPIEKNSSTSMKVKYTITNA